MGEFYLEGVVKEKYGAGVVQFETRLGRHAKSFPTAEDFDRVFDDLHIALEGAGYLDESGQDILAKLPKQINWWMLSSYSDPPVGSEPWGGIRTGTLILEDVSNYTWSFLLDTDRLDALPIGIAPPRINWPDVQDIRW